MENANLFSHLDVESTFPNEAGRKLPDITRLVNTKEVSGHTALLPTKNKTLVDFDEFDI
jgi:hypothetical protein